MSTQLNNTIIPTLRYRNAKSAIDWLCNAFGFEKHLIIEGVDDSIDHAQLVFGDSMIMIGSMSSDEYGKYIRTPETLNGVNTQASYIIVKEIDEHYKRSIQEGVEIVIDIKDEDYGGRGYTCRDLEGYLWSFGSYNPWNE